MQVIRCVVWRDDDHWLGYLRDHPEQWTQGKSMRDVREHLRDLQEHFHGPTRRRVLWAVEPRPAD